MSRLSSIWRRFARSITKRKTTFPPSNEHMAQRTMNSSPLAGTETGQLDYEYEPLQDAASIRLFELLPGLPESQLQIVIHSIHLPSTQKYEALSYTWGEPGQTHELSVSGGYKFKIRTNLQSALRELRLPSQSRWLWVDAICINQKDNAEKAGQLLLIPAIYRFSEQTIVYLGKADEHSDELLKYAEERAKATIRNVKLTKEGNADEVDEDKICEFIIRFLCAKDGPKSTKEAATKVEEFIKLLARPWFSRIWTIQEFAVAKRVVFRCGTATCEWYSLYFLFVEFLSIFKDLRRFVGSEDAYGESFMRGQAGFRGMMELRAKCLRSEPLDFQELIHTSSPRQASLDHDKVYGLLGLWQHTNRATMHLLPNYDLSVPAVYTAYATAFAKSSREFTTSTHNPALNLLYDASCCAQKLDGLPSWVPDWSKAPSRLSLGRNTKNISLSEIAMYYDASGWQSWTTKPEQNQMPLIPTPPKPSIFPMACPEVTDGILSFRGVICDEIEKLLRIPPVRSIRVDLPPLFEGMKTLVTNMARNPYPTGEDMATVAWKTLVGNRDGGGRSAPEEWAESYVAAPGVLQSFPKSFAFTVNSGGAELWDKAWGDEKAFLDRWPHSSNPEENLRYIYSSHPDPQTYASRLSDLKLYQRHTDFFTAIKHMAAGRTLCLTSKGFIGWVPDSAHPRDQICVIAEATIPFIVRPYDKETYHLVGESYIHGAMNGEYLQLDDVQVEMSTLQGNDGKESMFPYVAARVISFR